MADVLGRDTLTWIRRPNPYVKAHIDLSAGDDREQGMTDRHDDMGPVRWAKR